MAHHFQTFLVRLVQGMFRLGLPHLIDQYRLVLRKFDLEKCAQALQKVFFNDQQFLHIF